MPQQPERPFDSIESTYDFFRLLSEAVAEAKREIEGQVERASSAISSRRVDALRVALYSLEKLESHVTHSRRILNDLRSLRRLLFEERAAPKAVVLQELSKTEKPAMPRVPLSPPLHTPLAQVARIRAKSGGVVAA